MMPLTVEQCAEASPKLNLSVSSQVYNTELENIREFHGLTDFCSTFKLQRGKNENGDDDPTVVGELKVRYWCFIGKLLKMSIYWLQKANVAPICRPSGLFQSVPSARWPQCCCSSTSVQRAPRQRTPGVSGQGLRDPGHGPAAQRQQWQSENSSASQQCQFLQLTAAWRCSLFFFLLSVIHT